MNKFIVPFLTLFSCFGLYWFNPQAAKPTPKSIRLGIIVPEKTSSDNTIFIVSHGYAPEKTDVGKKQTKKLIENNIITSPAVYFEYNDTQKNANFGQSQNVQYLNTAIDYAIKKFPNKKIILIGVSRGASTILRWLGQSPLYNHQIKGAILESPFTSTRDMVAYQAAKFYPGIPKSIIPYIVKLLYPNMDPEDEAPFNLLNKIGPHIPLLIISSKKDTLIPAKNTKKIANTLQKYGHKKITYLELDSGNHGFLAQELEYQNAVKKFLRTIYNEEKK